MGTRLCPHICRIATAVGGILLGFYRPNVVSPGCWVNAPSAEPEGCSGNDCPERLFALVFGAIPSFASLSVIIVSNLMLYIHVRKTVMEGQKKCINNEKKLADFQSSVTSPPPQPESSTSKTLNDSSQHRDESCGGQLIDGP